MMVRLDPWKPAALCVLALSACQAVPKTTKSGARSDAVQTGALQDSATAAAAAFHAWAYSLPTETVLPPMTGSMRLHMRGDLAAFSGEDWDELDLPIGAEPNFDVKFQGRLELESWTRLRAQVDLVMDIGPLRAQSPEPLVVGLLLVADGETIWIEPDWSKAWFLEQLQGQATGFERLVFTIGTATVKEFMEVISGTMEGEAAEWYRNSLECASNPACLTRLLADHVKVESFARKGQRIVADLSMDMSEWMPAELRSTALAAPFRYRCEFDEATGAVLFTAYSMDMPESGLRMDFLQEMQLATKPFASERFSYELPKGRQAFPVDVFLNPILAGIRMETGQSSPDQSDQDLPF